MAEYYVNPNVGHTAHVNHAAPNHAPHATQAHANAMPQPTHAVHANAMPSYAANAMPTAYAPPYGSPLSADAILVLFILLVIVTRLCA
ncbi:hypothetical protein MO973_07055 [Paenibacillus sp. TRM 82003]|nr:hypothetical protein [Paenibacillus sp. TRM 82003]